MALLVQGMRSLVELLEQCRAVAGSRPADIVESDVPMGIRGLVITQPRVRIAQNPLDLSQQLARILPLRVEQRRHARQPGRRIEMGCGRVVDEHAEVIFGELEAAARDSQSDVRKQVRQNADGLGLVAFQTLLVGEFELELG